jgi:hypothetical protein
MENLGNWQKAKAIQKIPRAISVEKFQGVSAV